MSDVQRPSRAADRPPDGEQAPQELDWSADGFSALAHGAIEPRPEIDTSYDVAAPSAAPFEARVLPDRERVIVELSGELDLAAIPRFP